VLLATDAAGEGLNLHDACRLVVNLELPWNPMRIEQRIGRVDRIGQRRRVHACHLVAARTAESKILDRLKHRIEVAQSVIGGPDPLGHDDERLVARLVVLGDAPEPVQLRTALVPPDGAVDRAAAIDEAARIHAMRPFIEASAASYDSTGPLILIAHRGRTRRQLGSDLLMLWQVAAENADGRIVERRLISVLVSGYFPRERWTPARLASIFDAIDPELRSRITATASSWREEVERVDAAFRSMRSGRERAIAGAIGTKRPMAYQAGLFDRRAERVHGATAAVDAAQHRGAAERSLAVDRPIVAWPLDLVLVAVAP
jgi:hypothetical protein